MKGAGYEDVVGAFYSFEKYKKNWIISPGANKLSNKSLKPRTSFNGPNESIRPISFCNTYILDIILKDASMVQ